MLCKLAAIEMVKGIIMKRWVSTEYASKSQVVRQAKYSKLGPRTVEGNYVASSCWSATAEVPAAGLGRLRWVSLECNVILVCLHQQQAEGLNNNKDSGGPEPERGGGAGI